MRKRHLVGALVCGAVSILCLIFALSPHVLPRPAQQEINISVPKPVPVPAPEPSPAETEPAYESPINFEELQTINPDIYAWLSIPGAEIEYPILRREGDDTYYLDHGSDGAYYAGGALFVESAYNNADFTDPVTIIYGHRMNNGSMFGNVQALYSAEPTFSDCKEIVVYRPDRALRFSVFAAVPFEKTHILYNYDFSKRRVFQVFIDQILSTRTIGAVIDNDIEVSHEDQLLILSTCLKGNRDKRFLVCAAQVN